MLEANDIPVYCSFDELTDISSLVPNPRNPNTHPEKQIKLLAKIIKNQGWRAPITVSNRSGFIVRGHGRLMAAKLLELEQVPVDRQDYASEAEEWADLIADNRIAELAELDNEKLKDLLEELGAGDLDLELTGFTLEEIAELAPSDIQIDDPVEDDDFDVQGAFSSLNADETYITFTASEIKWPKGKCRICGELIAGHELNTHHIDTDLPIDQVNKVPNLASTHYRCHKLIHSITDSSNLVNKKIWKKIINFRERLKSKSEVS